MSYYEHDDAVRSILRRAALLKDGDDRETQQRVALRGYKGDEPDDVHRFQLPGIHSVPVKGGEGVIVEMGGRSDRALFLGGEHKDHKPKGYEPGDTVLYDHHGNSASLVKGRMRIVHRTEVRIVAPKIVLEGTVHLGGDGGKLVHRKDDVDSDGDAAVGSASKVYAV